MPDLKSSDRGYAIGALPSYADSNFLKLYEEFYLPKLVEIFKEYGESQFLITGVIKGPLSAVVDEKLLEKFLAMLQENDLKAGPMAVEQAKDVVKSNCKILKEQGESLNKFFLGYFFVGCKG